MPLSLSAKENKRLALVTGVIIPVMFPPGSVSAALKNPMNGAEILCLVFAGAAGGTTSDVQCILSLRPRGFDKAEAHAVVNAGIDGLLERKLAKSPTGRNIVLTAKGIKIYEKIISNMDALKPAPKAVKPTVPKTTKTKK